MIAIAAVVLGIAWAASHFFSDGSGEVHGQFVVQTGTDRPIVLYETPTAHDKPVGRILRGSRVFVEEVAVALPTAWIQQDDTLTLVAVSPGAK